MKYLIKTIAGIFFYLLFTGSIYAQVEKLNDGVVIHLEGANAKAIKLEVVSDRIIHVITSPVGSIHGDTSLMVITGNKKTEWSVDTKNDETTLATSLLKVIVELSTGRIKFHDLKDQPLLEEENNGSSFSATTIDGGPSWQIRQTFLSPKDEAFYGLGQHQQGIMNYKGELVELLQNNTEVAVPFLVSNNDYGILWENYSITQFGDGRKYQPLSELKLYDEKGNPGGLMAKYVSKKDSSKIFTRRTEQDISYDFLSSLTKFPNGFPLGDGKVTWQGSIESSLTGTHKFSVRYGGYIKVWVNGKLQLDAWRQCWNPATNILPVSMQAGKKYSLKIEWIPDGGESYAGINWLKPATSYNRTHFEISSEAANNINYYFVYGTSID
jgi:alpha-D-xyloside xylohydrolase